MKKYQFVTFKTQLNNIPLCKYDSEQIQHLLVHLFTNSVNVQKDITITIQSLADEKFVHIIVEDNGPGIPEDVRKDLFVSYMPKKNSYGLFLCKSIVDRHNGEIKLHDSETGTKIEISLPIV
jgi:signal transduction histidine kinase